MSKPNIKIFDAFMAPDINKCRQKFHMVWKKWPFFRNRTGNGSSTQFRATNHRSSKVAKSRCEYLHLQKPINVRKREWVGRCINVNCNNKGDCVFYIWTRLSRFKGHAVQRQRLMHSMIRTWRKTIVLLMNTVWCISFFLKEFEAHQSVALLSSSIKAMWIPLLRNMAIML